MKLEDLNPNSIHIASKDQAELDAIFVGFVRIAIVDPDPSVTHKWRTVNQRDTFSKHRRDLHDSFRTSKEDWDHPLNVLADPSKIDKSCLSQSIHPVNGLKPIERTCAAEERILEYLSGSHRAVAAKDLYNELIGKKEKLEEQLELHLEERAAGGQAEIGADGDLTDTLGDGIRTLIALTEEAAEDARLWTCAVYDCSEYCLR